MSESASLRVGSADPVAEAVPARCTPPAIYRAALADLLELCAISSVTGDAEGIGRANALLASRLRGFGFEVREHLRPGQGGSLQPVLEAWTGGAAPPTSARLIAGHTDTVLPPWPATLDSGRLSASGVVDMKGGLVALLAALAWRQQEGRPLPPDLFLVIVPDEEIAGPLCREHMAAAGRNARQVLVLEPAFAFGEAESVVIGRRGMIHWDLHLVGRAGHAGNAFWESRSASYGAAEFCQLAESLAHPGPGPTVNVARLVAGDASFVENLENLGHLVGSGRQINIVPNRAIVEGEARFLAAEDGPRLEAALADGVSQLAARRGLAANWRIRERIAPLDPRDSSRALAQHAVELAAQLGFPLVVEEDRRGISFPNFIDQKGLPVLDGLGPVGAGMHTTSEYLDLTSFDRRIALLAELLDR